MYVVMWHADGSMIAPAGSQDGFVEVYKRTVTDVYSYLASRVGDRAVAEDLTQDVFIAGARRVAESDTVDLAWLIAVARHKVIDHWRARTREERHLARAHFPHREPVVELPAALDPGRAAATLARLNETYRAALVLRHVDGLSVGEVAAELGRTVAAVEQILTRARSAFRSTYQGDADA
jgi:RNA polymerase sigma-70 factor (ECF subfamily)